MIFIILFVSGMLVVPLIIDINKHGSDNILVRSSRELLEFESISSIVRFIHSPQNTSIYVLTKNIFKFALIGVVIALFVVFLYSYITSKFILFSTPFLLIVMVGWWWFVLKPLLETHGNSTWVARGKEEREREREKL